MTAASPPIARNGAATGAPLRNHAPGSPTEGSRRATAMLVVLVAMLLAEGVGWAVLRPEMSALAFWTCAACHA